MSNKRRKNRGSSKLARNLQIRLRRGAAKMGNPLPGESRTYSSPHLAAAYVAHGAQLRERVEQHTATYWRGR